MKNLFWVFFYFSSLLGTDSFEEWFQEGKVSGNIRYYYIETNKKFITDEYSSAHANSVGGQLNYTTSLYNGWRLGTAFMTTQPFLLPELVESSSIGQDNGFRGKNPATGFSVMGEAYAGYANTIFNVWYGRRVITTPMIAAKDVRMLPSSVQGGEGKLFLNETTSVSVGYLDRFKQRSSDGFTNIIKHALGADTRAITGKDEGFAIPLTLTYKDAPLTLNLYDLYAPDFFNTAYGDIEYKGDFYTLSAQGVLQNSIGNANDNLAQATSVTKGKKIKAAGVGVRAEVGYKESSLDLVYRNIVRDSDSYDSLITPWDGTLLYAYSSTTNNLGQSFYGNALTAGGAYVGGTRGYKIGYTQKYDFTRLKGFSTHIAYALYTNPRYREDQEDIKGILRYKRGNWSFELKGIWINNDTYTTKDGTVNQLDWLTQFHGIANYAF
jgi:hypothetical protein